MTTILLLSANLSAQTLQEKSRREVPAAALRYLQQNQQRLGLKSVSADDFEVSSETVSKPSGMRHVYLQQKLNGITIHGAITTFNISKDEQVLPIENRFRSVPASANSLRTAIPRPALSAADAVAQAARSLGISVKGGLSILKKLDGPSRAVQFSKAGISLEPISARLVYQAVPNGELRLAWEVSIYELNALNYWNIRLDAATGRVLDRDNLVTQCEFDNPAPAGASVNPQAHQPLLLQPSMLATPSANAYHVYPVPVETPIHGTRDYVATTAADGTASPSGWHSAEGVNYTTTRGNNVHAYEDPDNNNNFAGTNYSPDGGASLLFDYPVDLTQQPVAYRDAATTNLFYMNNIMHDVWYQYGFDEVNGNFQVENYGKGGLGADYVRAEAQDSRNIRATRNNANFFTPVDGQRPRMQMYLWSPPADPELFRVTSPSTVAGIYKAAESVFAAPLTPTGVSGKLVLANTSSGIGQEGCTSFSNPASIAGNIAVVYRGGCTFLVKVQNAQAAGATAVIVINNAPGDPITMTGTPSQPITIPAVMVSQATGATLRAAMDAGEDVMVVLRNTITDPEVDGDFDNGIIAHEYGHGISIRLTGGPANVSCLQNAEQMGEGWSDWFGLMLTMKPGDTSDKRRGIGTYVLNQPTTGQGIRPAPYSTDFGVNNYTYGATNNLTLTQPHGVGFVWATMLWDLNWALIDKYGFNADVYHGTGGNNKAMQLVIDGLKMQPCSPGFVDGRDAILAADVADNGGANQKLIWKVFARRGLGYSASQGSNFSRTDQVEAFDLPPLYACLPPTITVNPLTTFTGGAPNTIYLGYGVQSVTLQSAGENLVSYAWSPSTGLNSTTSAAPTFTPTAAGTYTFTLTATNNNNCVESAQVTVNVVDVRCGKKNDKVQVCHRGSVLCVSTLEANTHVAHGDKVGVCGSSAGATTASVGESNASLQLALESADFIASPNPTSGNTRLVFKLTHAGSYKLEVLNMQGAVVAVVANGKGEAGKTYSHDFSAGKLAGGVYIARLQMEKGSRFARILIQN